MRKEYNVKKLKIKRRGVLPELAKEEHALKKVRITISLDKDIVDYFKSEAVNPGAFPYQTQINQTLRKTLGVQHQENLDFLKANLLKDTKFIHQLAKKIQQDQGKNK